MPLTANPVSVDTAALIAEGPGPDARHRWPLEGPGPWLLGRDALLATPWDREISRTHVKLSRTLEGLLVDKLPQARNPLFHEGQPVATCQLASGGQFVIGTTVFRFVSGSAAQSPASAAAPTPTGDSNGSIEQVTFTRQTLDRIRYRDADRRIEILSRMPAMIGDAASDDELAPRLAGLLLAGVAHAEAAALVELQADGAVRVLAWDRRRETEGVFRPSTKLVTEAVTRRGVTVLHLWDAVSQPRSVSEFTATQELDWAFCSPVPAPGERPWAFYLAGRMDGLGIGLLPPVDAATGRSSTPTGGEALQADVKFTELVAEFVGSVRRLRGLERTQTGLRQFFPPVILAALGKDDESQLLAPRESDVTVLFCDLRGFSRQAELERDNLIALLDRVSSALDVVTHHIMAHGGVIGDFQGDAAMGFWGWPVWTPDDPLRACRAALAIRKAFAEAAEAPQHPLARFATGMGLARGKAVAGKIGTTDHVKVTVFGPVVNLASRLEGLTKQLRVPIVLDESLASVAREHLPASEGRVRTLARVLPYGLETPVLVAELMPGEQELPEFTAAHLADYDAAVEHFLAGRWEPAYRLLRTMPPGDRAQDVLTGQIVQSGRVAPPAWPGYLRFEGK
jgi:adenylate cyclase